MQASACALCQLLGGHEAGSAAGSPLSALSSADCRVSLRNPSRIFHFYVCFFRPFVDGFLAFYHFGICCVYVVFIAESIKQLVDEYLVEWDVRLHMCLLIVPLLLIFSIRNLKLLAPFSSAANLLLFVGMSA